MKNTSFLKIKLEMIEIKQGSLVQVFRILSPLLPKGIPSIHDAGNNERSNTYIIHS